MGVAAGLIAVLIWASTNIIVRSESDRIDVVTLNALRVLAATPLALALPFFMSPIGTNKPETAMGGAYVIIGALLSMGVGDGIYFKSQQLLGVSRAQPIGAIAPIFTLMLAAAFLGEQPTWALAGAIPLVILGVCLLAMKSASASAASVTFGSEQIRRGIALAVGAAICWAIGNIMFRQALLEMDVARANQLRIPIVALFLLASMWLMGRPFTVHKYGWRSMGLITAVGISSMGIGTLFYLYSVQATGATRASLISSLAPFFAAPLAVLFLGEKLTWRTIAGMLCCIGGVWLVLISTGGI